MITEYLGTDWWQKKISWPLNPFKNVDPFFKTVRKLPFWIIKWGCLSILTLSILTLSRMTLSKVLFSDILRNDYLDHFDTFGENFDFDTFKNDTFENDTFESVWVDRHPHSAVLHIF